ncbi:hypothetical protein RRG08_038031 [Elysia crispata]|uniref:Uncharacterized protein n=1 Tax=Elysia crispata TaxID=231223 RepID=A0AAE1DNZ7_9GAST|nr:hypothetical protein RRG08_038031 [Elysia crispata]
MQSLIDEDNVLKLQLTRSLLRSQGQAESRWTAGLSVTMTTPSLLEHAWPSRTCLHKGLQISGYSFSLTAYLTLMSFALKLFEYNASLAMCPKSALKEHCP